MADLFNKHIKKATSRTKEKLLEGIGKAKATQDETFDNYAANLTKQSKACERLHKDLKAYSSALKTLCQAEKTLRDTIRDAYEPEWPEREQLTSMFDNLDIQTTELEKSVCDELTSNVSQYVAQFGDLKKKVDKRGRKLVDYDHAKHSYTSVKASSKKENDPKVSKALSELHAAEQMYSEINNELLEVLPATYDSRITFFVDTLQTLFNSNNIHQAESSRLNKQVVNQLDKLGQSMDSLRVPRPEPRPLTPVDTTDGSRPTTPSPAPTPTATPISTPAPAAAAAVAPTPTKGDTTNPFGEEHEEEKEEPAAVVKEQPVVAAARKIDRETPKREIESPKKKKEKDPNNPFDESDEEDTPIETKDHRKILYKVKSTHEYKAVDSDELTFQPGEEINVLEATVEDQLDDGWKLGEKADGTRGVFPENFTKKVE